MSLLQEVLRSRQRSGSTPHLDLSQLSRTDLQSRPEQSPPLSKAPETRRGSGFTGLLQGLLGALGKEIGVGERANPATFARGLTALPRLAKNAGQDTLRLLPELVGEIVRDPRKDARPVEITNPVFRALVGDAPITPPSTEGRELTREFGAPAGTGAFLLRKGGQAAAIAAASRLLGPALRGSVRPSALPSAPRVPRAAQTQELVATGKSAGTEVASDAGSTVRDALGRSTRQTSRPRTGTRKFSTTVKDSFRTNKELAQRIEPEAYQQLSNKELVRSAKRLVDSDFDEAIRIAKSPAKPTAQSNVIAQEVIRSLQKRKLYDQAAEVVEITAQKATSSGQAIQALSLYNRLEPAGVLRYAQKLFDRANAERPNLNLKLDKALAQKLTESAEKLQKMRPGREKTLATARMLDDVFKEIPPTIWEKVSHAQRLAQLLNPKTAIRNVIGNLGFAGAEVASDVVGTGLDSAVAALRGVLSKRPAAEFRTKTLPDLPGQLRAAKGGLDEGLAEARAGVRTGPQSQFDIPQTPVFRGGIGSRLEKALDIELRVPDRAAYRAAYADELRNQMAIARMQGKKITKPTSQMEEAAHLQGLYRTFQDDNAVSAGLSTIKRGLNKLTRNEDFGIGEVVLKYPKTPGALVARGIEYSPAGFFKSAFELLRPFVLKQPFRQRAFVDATSRSLTGTGTQVVLGAYLHRLGIVTGRRVDNRNVAEFSRETGLGEYRLNLSGLKRWVLSGFNPEKAKPIEGDKTVNYDWFQPAAIGVSMGANIDQNLQDPKNQSGLGFVATLVNSVAGGAATLAEQPVLQGLQRLFGGYDPVDALVRTATGIPASFVPTLSNQVRQLTDNVSRNTYDPNTILYVVNRVKGKIPGLAQTLPARVSPLGEVRDIYDEDANNLFNVFANPAFVENLDLDPTVQYVLDLYDETGETGHFPRVAPKTVNLQGMRFELTAEQIGELQTVIGRATHELIGRKLQSEDFLSLPPAEQARRISSDLSKIGQVGRTYVISNLLSDTLQR